MTDEPIRKRDDVEIESKATSLPEGELARMTDDIVVNVTIDYTASSAGLGQTLVASSLKSLTEIRDALTADRGMRVERFRSLEMT